MNLFIFYAEMHLNFARQSKVNENRVQNKMNLFIFLFLNPTTGQDSRRIPDTLAQENP